MEGCKLLELLPCWASNKKGVDLPRPEHETSSTTRLSHDAVLQQYLHAEFCLRMPLRMSIGARQAGQKARPMVADARQRERGKQARRRECSSSRQSPAPYSLIGPDITGLKKLSCRTFESLSRVCCSIGLVRRQLSYCSVCQVGLVSWTRVKKPPLLKQSGFPKLWGPQLPSSKGGSRTLCQIWRCSGVSLGFSGFDFAELYPSRFTLRGFRVVRSTMHFGISDCGRYGCTVKSCQSSQRKTPSGKSDRKMVGRELRPSSTKIAKGGLRLQLHFNAGLESLGVVGGLPVSDQCRN